MFCANTIGTVLLTLPQHWRGPAGASQDDIWAERNQFCRVLVQAGAVVSAPTVIDPQVAADGPTRLLQSLQECRDVGLRLGLVRAREHEHTDAPYALGLLRARRERPRRRRAAEQRDELAPPHVLPQPEDRTLPHRCRECRVVHHSKVAADVRSWVIHVVVGRGASVRRCPLRPE